MSGSDNSFNGFDDEAQGGQGLTLPERMGRLNGRMSSPAYQIVSGLSRMQDNIKSIRAMRTQKLLEDKQNELAMGKADLGIQEMELQLGPDGAAAAREEFNLKKKKTQIDSQLADRSLQRAQLGAEESFSNGVRFATEWNKKLRAEEAKAKAETGQDFFLGNVGIDKDQNFTLDKQQVTKDRDKELALKAAGEAMDVDKYDQAMALLSRGSAAPIPSADAVGTKTSIKNGTRIRNKSGEVRQYNGQSRRWEKV